MGSICIYSVIIALSANSCVAALTCCLIAWIAPRLVSKASSFLPFGHAICGIIDTPAEL